MFRKAPYLVGVILLLGSVAFFNRSWLEIGYLKGKLVAFPSSHEISSKDAKTILIVGSEGTKNQQLYKKVKNVCPQLRVSMKVNRYTNLEWQEAHELHGLMRKRSFDIVLVETQSSDFSPKNRDLIARFETTAKKSGSNLFYWSPEKVENAPTNFIGQTSNLKRRICPAREKEAKFLPAGTFRGSWHTYAMLIENEEKVVREGARKLQALTQRCASSAKCYALKATSTGLAVVTRYTAAPVGNDPGEARGHALQRHRTGEIEYGVALCLALRFLRRGTS